MQNDIIKTECKLEILTYSSQANMLKYAQYKIKIQFQFNVK